ncbi:uncharacterized protein TRAVEDRAFT_21615 [Trametes versicolor FP-101664 SS1]|uniref:uncharacterized protein n=1 Tax=Trametes versicolor (strain FP-101664) TaxID=717944 RepID=UPI00046219CC|nr:uncharacterized protein TRAVEDRAFT_21615 [Trametes versicolor FP-101664 SS1]EIW56438.1 hypothetical protein TRAVEDRAFT_21615 [Trametes versicolor FP-101664 SS1]
MNPAAHLSATEILDQVLWRDTERIFAALSQAQGAARSSVAALAMLTWDILTTMDEEVKLIWPIQNVRVAVPCVPWLIFQIMSTFLVEAAVEVIIILRIYAVYAAQRKVLRIMLLGLAVQLAIMIVSLGLSINKVRTGWDCKAADLPTEMVLYSTASIVYESFLFGLMMYGILRGGKDAFSETTLVNALSFEPYAKPRLVVVMSMNTILFTLAPSTLVTLGFPWLLAVLGSAGPRLIVKLRAQHANNIGGPSSLGNLRFKTPSHFYSALNLDDLEEPSRVSMQYGVGEEGEGSEGEESSEDEAEGEHVALNPRRRTISGQHALSPSEVEAQTPPSPLSPPIPLPG